MEGHGRRSVSCALRILLLLPCAVVSASADAAGISSRLPHQILMNTSLQVEQPPVKMDLLSVRWEHKGRPLVEYKEGNLTFHSPWAVMSLQQLRQGNISLVLTNLTQNDAGNYTCVVQYAGVQQTAVYDLIIARNRIRLLNLTPPPLKAGVSSVKTTKKRPVPYVYGDLNVTAQPGDNVTLQCRFKMDRAIELSMLSVHWSKDGATKYYSNKTCCDFPGHDILEEDLQNGSAPLQLVNVQEKDTGAYTCAIKYEATERSWNTALQVKRIQETNNGLEKLSWRSTPNREDGQSDQLQSERTSPVITGHDGPLATRGRHLSIQTVMVTAELTPRADDSVIAESMPQYRTLKFGLVSGALAVTGLVAAFVYICFQG